MGSTQAWVSAPKHGLRCRLVSSYTNNGALVSTRLRPRSVAFSGRNGVCVKAGVEGSTQKPILGHSVPCSAQENSLQNVLVEVEGVSVERAIRSEPEENTRSAFGRVAVLAGGDMLALLTFAAIGRLSHGMTVLDWDAFRTADPFIAGWLLGAYFLGGYGPEGQGANGVMKAVFATVMSWAMGIPLGLVIKGVTAGHFLAPAFILVSMGSTIILLVAWRAVFTVFSAIDEHDRKKLEL